MCRLSLPIGLLSICLFFAGCGSKDADEWTVVEVLPGGSYEETSEDGEVFGHVTDGLKCVSGGKAIYLHVEDFCFPAGIWLDDRFKFSCPLDDVPHDKDVYYATDEHVVKITP
ncbi:hypothetical protein [Planctomycetes bacterium K23_9]|uniref:Lipoprotein n=1 Tax=Stieleria marina TaxID=1930275 RepID=A0A517NTT4_9BACT|nr:hypothetical protein K239x_24900 [Planctomycetes bacterium K23_9]